MMEPRGTRSQRREGPARAERIAAVDVGTNTALLLVADVVDGRVEPCYEAQRFVRLGEGVDATGVVNERAMGRLRDALLAYRRAAEERGAAEIVVAATSASRDARNAAELADFVRRETGLRYEILSGDEEALWTFHGAVSAFDDLDGPVVVIDVGGGSTEMILGEPSGPASGGVRFRRSVDVGAVRLTERFFSTQPPSRDEVAAAERFTEELVRRQDAAFGGDAALVGAAGTASALALVHSGAADWSALGGGVLLDADAVEGWRRRLLGQTFDQVLALSPEVLSGRADVFPAGVLVIDVFMRTYGFERLRVSQRGLRHGLALRRATGAGGEGWNNRYHAPS